MLSRRSRHLVACGVAGSIGLAMVSVWVVHDSTSAPHAFGSRFEARTSEPATNSGHPASPAISCKPTPPVVVSLVPGTTRGAWSVRIEAFESTPQVVVESGTRRSDRVVSRVPVWTGALAAGEQRLIEFPLDAAAGHEDAEIWVEANVPMSAGNVLRSVDSAPASSEVHAQKIPPADPGILNRDAQGEWVVEYSGVQEGAR